MTSTVTAAEAKAPGCAPVPGDGRPCVDGKFLRVGDARLRLCGVTYGPFAPGDDGSELPDRDQVGRDLDAMIAAGINAVRLYSVPPVWVLELAAVKGVWVLVGLAWEQHVTFLDNRQGADELVSRVRAQAESVAGHRALLGYAVGNEIPSPIVRWHGRRRVERCLKRMCAAVKSVDPRALVTYVNYPSTEYLDLPFVDFVAFNVYLEDPDKLAAYVARLQNIANERPLVLTEIGLDSRRNGLDEQAASLFAQIRSGFRGGCAGTFAFAWTDEWHRGGEDVLDWEFGLTDRSRRPKPALSAVSSAYASAPVVDAESQPAVSVVVCTRNGAATLDECLTGLGQLDYPDYEVIVVDDGSTDDSAKIAERHPVVVLRTTAQGLSAARNEGLAVARGELIAFLDDDATPDREWLTFLVIGFGDPRFAAIGGPNLPVGDDGIVAECVAHSPGGPQHVLLADDVAEHIPGCNMAFRRDALLAINGFDEQFTRAGDDVDVCWRLQEQGMTIGFHSAAVVWHHRRAKISRYLGQQRGYGAAEALLERKWPEKYNSIGQPRWSGRLYGPGGISRLSASRIYYGVWGTGAFQPAIGRRRSRLISLGAAPELYLVALLLALLTIGGIMWTPLWLAMIPLAATVVLLIGHAVSGAAGARFIERAVITKPLRYALTGALHLLQPIVRLCGRLENGLSPWRRPRDAVAMGVPGSMSVWLEHWGPLHDRISRIEATLRSQGFLVRRGDAYSRWELEVITGAFAGVRVWLTAEEHGSGRQMIRARIQATPSRWRCAFAIALTMLAILAVLDEAWLVGALLCLASAVTTIAIVTGCALAAGASRRAIGALVLHVPLSAVKASECESDSMSASSDNARSIAATVGTRS